MKELKTAADLEANLERIGKTRVMKYIQRDLPPEERPAFRETEGYLKGAYYTYEQCKSVSVYCQKVYYRNPDS